MWKNFFTVITTLSNILTALLWMISATREISQNSESGTGSKGLQPAQIFTTERGGKSIDFIATAQDQAKWNKWAAFSSAFTVIFQLILRWL
jgi:hypothetical protein